MDRPTARLLEVARDRLLCDGAAASQFGVISVGHPLLMAGHSLNAVLSAHSEIHPNPPLLRAAAHKALGALECVSIKQERWLHDDVYQALLDIAYANGGEATDYQHD